MNTDETNSNRPLPSPEQWVDLYGNYMYRYALARLSDPEAAQDVVQEALVAAIQAYNRFEGKSSVKTWLIAILKRKIVDYFRRAKNLQSMDSIEVAPNSVGRVFDDSGNWLVRPAEWKVNPGKAYEQREFIDVLYKCIAKLPERLAEIFMLREFEELDTEQICIRLGITDSNCWVMLYRARLQLKGCLELNWLGN